MMTRLSRQGFESWLLRTVKPSLIPNTFAQTARDFAEQDSICCLHIGHKKTNDQRAYYVVSYQGEYYVHQLDERFKNINPDRVNWTLASNHNIPVRRLDLPPIIVEEVHAYNVDSDSIILKPEMPLELAIKIFCCNQSSGKLGFHISWIFECGIVTQSTNNSNEVFQRGESVIRVPLTPMSFPAQWKRHNGRALTGILACVTLSDGSDRLISISSMGSGVAVTEHIDEI